MKPTPKDIDLMLGRFADLLNHEGIDCLKVRNTGDDNIRKLLVIDAKDRNKAEQISDEDGLPVYYNSIGSCLVGIYPAY
jgi:hypothetical protein